MSDNLPEIPPQVTFQEKTPEQLELHAKLAALVDEASSSMPAQQILIILGQLAGHGLGMVPEELRSHIMTVFMLNVEAGLHATILRRISNPLLTAEPAGNA